MASNAHSIHIRLLHYLSNLYSLSSFILSSEFLLLNSSILISLYTLEFEFTDQATKFNCENFYNNHHINFYAFLSNP